MKRMTYEQIEARLQELDYLHEHTPLQAKEYIDLENTLDDMKDELQENRM